MRIALGTPAVTTSDCDAVQHGLTADAKVTRPGNDWAPRVSVALGEAEGHWPILRPGYGMYFGRTENATVETALTQTGAPMGI